MTKYKKCIGSAVIRIKFIKRVMNAETELFEDIISSSNTCIKVDFSNGVSLVEDRYRRLDRDEYKFFIDFYDNYKNVDLIDYLTSSESDYRVTTEDGIIIRTCINDFNFVEDEKISSKKRVNVNFFEEIGKMFMWK